MVMAADAATIPPLILPDIHPAPPGKARLIYRLQRFDGASTGMHWQIEKGGGFHFNKACERGEALPVSVIMGGPPALTIAAIAPLPEGVAPSSADSFHTAIRYPAAYSDR